MSWRNHGLERKNFLIITGFFNLQLGFRPFFSSISIRIFIPYFISASSGAVTTDTHIWFWSNLRREVGPIFSFVSGMLFQNDRVVQVYHFGAII